jgi:hypothetical protein
MTVSDFRALFTTLLVGVVGDTQKEWQRVIAAISTKPLSMSPASNWSIEPAGTARQRKAVRWVEAVTPAELPYVDQD